MVQSNVSLTDENMKGYTCRAVSRSGQVTRGNRSCKSELRFRKNGSSGLRYGGPIRESEFGPLIWRSGFGTRVVGLRPGGAWFGRYDSSSRSLLQKGPSHNFTQTQTHIDQFMTISLPSCLLPIYSDCSITHWLVKSSICLTNENINRYTQVVPGFHKHFQNWIKTKKNEIEARSSGQCGL